MIAGAIGFVGGDVPTGIYAIARSTYRAGPRPELVSTTPIDDPFAPGAEPSFTYGRPWLAKRFTDVVVHGAAHSLRPVSTMRVVAAVGDRAVELDVLGRRVIEWEGDRPRFSTPEPFTRMEIGWGNAYGGIDLRVDVPVPRCDDDRMALRDDHPGLYPRNPFGKGYLVTSDPMHGIELPNVEDPRDRLTPERILVRDPTAWHRQPLPAGFGPMHPRFYARMVHFGVDAWFPGPDDAALGEVRAGLLPPGFRSVLGDAPTLVPHPGFFQEAPAGLRFGDLRAGTPIRVEGMHPEGKSLRFDLPASPVLDVVLEGRVQPLVPRLNLVVLRPEEETVELTYTAVTRRMHRVFVPGVHADIPLSLRVGGGPTIPYLRARAV